MKSVLLFLFYHFFIKGRTEVHPELKHDHVLKVKASKMALSSALFSLGKTESVQDLNPRALFKAETLVSRSILQNDKLLSGPQVK